MKFSSKKLERNKRNKLSYIRRIPKKSYKRFSKNLKKSSKRINFNKKIAKFLMRNFVLICQKKTKMNKIFKKNPKI